MELSDDRVVKVFDARKVLPDVVRRPAHAELVAARGELADEVLLAAVVGGQVVAVQTQAENDYAALSNPQPLIAKDIQALLSGEEALIAFAAADGRTLWHTQLRAGNNSCPAVGGDVLVIAAGAKHPRFAQPVTEVVAYKDVRKLKSK